MNRPEVSVVMPFAGDEAAARAPSRRCARWSRAPGDELILADNSRGCTRWATCADAGVDVVRPPPSARPRTPATPAPPRAGRDWILFLDADCEPPAGSARRVLRRAVADDVGALAGEVVPATGPRRSPPATAPHANFLGQQAHLAHPYRPRAVAANLLVRRAAFEQVGGFYEGVRAAEDTDFSWRLQQAGWRLELRSGALV